MGLGTVTQASRQCRAVSGRSAREKGGLPEGASRRRTNATKDEGIANGRRVEGWLSQDGMGWGGIG